MTDEQQEQISDWRDDVAEGAIATLKVQDGETVKVVFVGEGRKSTHPDFGDSIVFEVEVEAEKMNFYVNPENYSLLRQIKELGDKLTGVVAEISRTGSKKSDTRYTVTKIE
jgi:hypothetical protein